eukprot:CAMPEP_0119038990 /NCGR_PEP_ID=MMETSP1177-20130426/8226_1 /TAXON_ID=2985 /ORGANISM="Ochromonas sp, Strain CCMP1899" /LENGTH=279 /DNA_ID=CAMNT_0007002277 /DNA_START=274 /DNA_END=1113 /DNA_ORIENTATION=-
MGTATRSARSMTIDKYLPVFSITLGLVFEDEYGLNFEAFKNPLFWRAVVGEFIGSIFFLFLTISSVIASDGDIMVVSSCFGSVILILIYSLQDTSGAHFNPAVTFAGMISNELSVVRGVTYMIAQVAGCIVGVALVLAMAPTRFAAYNGGANIVKSDIAPGGAFIGEIVCTTLFVLVVLFATDQIRKDDSPQTYALCSVAIGIAVMVSHFALIGIDGCSINPARSLGSAVVSGQWDDFWVFIVGPFVGSFLAAFVYDVMRARPQWEATLTDESKAFGGL